MFPTRPKQHVSESKGMALLQTQLPSDWVVRSLSERDYGIDVVIELDREGFMVGDMIVAQVKSTEKTPLNNAHASFKGVRAETLRYLLGQPAPAYLFVASTSEQRVFWRSLREHNRELAEGADFATIELRDKFDLSEMGITLLRLSQLREKEWPKVEQAMMASLMFYNSLGPLYLGCKRYPASAGIPSSVQQLLIAHFEYNSLLQTYVMLNGGKYRALPEYYEEAIADNCVSEHMTFKGSFAIRFLSVFIGDYLNAIAACDHIVRVSQRPYWAHKYAFSVGHMKSFPPYFFDEDWYARYYFDEYERETKSINLDFFRDVPASTRRDFLRFSNMS